MFPFSFLTPDKITTMQFPVHNPETKKSSKVSSKGKCRKYLRFLTQITHIPCVFEMVDTEINPCKSVQAFLLLSKEMQRGNARVC